VTDSTQTNLYTVSNSLAIGDNLLEYLPDSLKSAGCDTYSMIVTFSDAVFEEFDASKVSRNDLEEAWFFNNEICFHIRRSSPDTWKFLITSESRLGIEDEVPFNAAYQTRTHALTGLQLEGESGLFYEEVMPRPRTYPMGTDDRNRLGLKCIHYSFSENLKDGHELKHRIFRPTGLIELKEAGNG